MSNVPALFCRLPHRIRVVAVPADPADTAGRWRRAPCLGSISHMQAYTANECVMNHKYKSYTLGLATPPLRTDAASSSSAAPCPDPVTYWYHTDLAFSLNLTYLHAADCPIRREAAQGACRLSGPIPMRSLGHEYSSHRIRLGLGGGGGARRGDARLRGLTISDCAHGC